MKVKQFVLPSFFKLALVVCATMPVQMPVAHADSGACMREIEGGRVNWGGGTVWNPANATRLCAGSNSVAPARCFTAALAQGQTWPNGIAMCEQSSQHCVHSRVGTVDTLDSQGVSVKPTDKSDVMTWRLAFHACQIGELPSGLLAKDRSISKCLNDVKPYKLGSIHLDRLCGGEELYKFVTGSWSPAGHCFTQTRRLFDGEQVTNLYGLSARNRDHKQEFNEWSIELCSGAGRLAAALSNQGSRQLPPFSINRDCFSGGLNYLAGKSQQFRSDWPIERLVEACSNEPDETYLRSQCLSGFTANAKDQHFNPQTGAYIGDRGSFGRLYPFCFG